MRNKFIIRGALFCALASLGTPTIQAVEANGNVPQAQEDAFDHLKRRIRNGKEAMAKVKSSLIINGTNYAQNLMEAITVLKRQNTELLKNLITESMATPITNEDGFESWKEKFLKEAATLEEQQKKIITELLKTADIQQDQFLMGFIFGISSKYSTGTYTAYFRLNIEPIYENLRLGWLEIARNPAYAKIRTPIEKSLKQNCNDFINFVEDDALYIKQQYIRKIVDRHNVTAYYPNRMSSLKIMDSFLDNKDQKQLIKTLAFMKKAGVNLAHQDLARMVDCATKDTENFLDSLGKQFQDFENFMTLLEKDASLKDDYSIEDEGNH